MAGRREFLWLRLHLRSALEVSFIERGDEIYVFADYWPKPPPTIIINEDIEMADISIMKNVLATDLTKEQNCISYHSKSYGGTNIYLLKINNNSEVFNFASHDYCSFNYDRLHRYGIY